MTSAASSHIHTHNGVMYAFLPGDNYSFAGKGSHCSGFWSVQRPLFRPRPLETFDIRSIRSVADGEVGAWECLSGSDRGGEGGGPGFRGAPPPPPPSRAAPKMYLRLLVFVLFFSTCLFSLFLCLLFLTTIMNKGNRGVAASSLSLLTPSP